MSETAERLHEVTFEITQQELLDASRLSVFASIKTRKWLFLAFVVFFSLSVILTMAFDQNWDSNTPFLIVTGAVLLFPLFHYFVVLPRMCRRQVAMVKSLLQPHTWSWDADTFRIRGSTGESYIPWADIYQMHENQRLAIILPRPGMMYILPKRVLDAGALQNLRASFAASRQRA